TNPLDAQTKSLCSDPHISHKHASHPRADPGNNFPGNGSRLFSEFRAGDFLTAVAPHENNFVTDLNTLYLTHVDHHQIHRHSAHHVATLPSDQDSGPAVGKVPWIAIGVTRR